MDTSTESPSDHPAVTRFLLEVGGVMRAQYFREFIVSHALRSIGRCLSPTAVAPFSANQDLHS